MSNTSTRQGTFIGTGAAVDVKGDKVGFKPRKVAIFNETRNSQAVWTEDMGDGTAQKTVDSGSNKTDVSKITSGGITPLATGFTLGNDSDLNGSNDVIRFECWG